VTADGLTLSSGTDIKQDDTASSIVITGGNASNVGANILLYGSTHATNANVFRIRQGAVERLRITSTGNVEVSTGNLVIGTAGKGIDFSAQTSTTATGAAASSGGEVLDHYEEGTWTPIVQLGGISISVSYAKYVKIGKKVTVQLYYNASGTGSSARLEIKGLPFNTESLGYVTGAVDTGGNNPHICRTQSSSDYIIFKKATLNTWATGADLDTGHIILTLTYFV
jgi:hypothetical protein